VSKFISQRNKRTKLQYQYNNIQCVALHGCPFAGSRLLTTPFWTGKESARTMGKGDV